MVSDISQPLLEGIQQNAKLTLHAVFIIDAMNKNYLVAPKWYQFKKRRKHYRFLKTLQGTAIENFSELAAR